MEHPRKTVGKLREDNPLTRLHRLNEFVRRIRPKDVAEQEDREPIRKVVGRPRPK